MTTKIPDAAQATVLIVDDEESLRETLAAFLSAAGYTVAVAENVAQAEALLAQTPYDIVVSDIIMPRGSGIELMRRLQDSAPDTLVLMMTGEPTVETAVQAVQAGAFEYLVKPVTKDILLLAMSRAAQVVALKRARAVLEADNLRYRKNLECLVAERTHELSDRQQELAAIYASAPVALLLVDSEYRVRKANAVAGVMAGLQAGQTLGGSLRRTVLKMLVSSEEILQEEILQAEVSVPSAGAGDSAVARTYLVSATSVTIQEEVLALVALQEITERKRAELSLKALLDLLRAIVESVPMRVFWKDTECRYLGCNSTFARDAGMSCPEDLIGKDDTQMGWREQADSYRSDDTQVMGSDTPKLGYEELQTTPDGQVIRLRTSKVPLHTVDGTVFGILGVYDDITEQRQLEEQVQHAQNLEIIGQLAAGVAHDFNNLLTGIGSFAQFALEAVSEDCTSMREDLTEVIALGRRATDLTRQLLAFSRRQALQLAVTDLNDLIMGLAKTMPRLIGEHIEICYALNASPSEVEVDPGQIEQVLMNLAVNARDAVTETGRLTIETSNVDRILDRDDLEASAMSQQGYVLLTVTDTGRGMDASVREHMFEPFFTTKEVGKGTGLGLATVYGIVKQHNGEVFVDSEVGRGTTFRIYLPQAVVAIESEATKAPARPVAETGMILVVEDEETVRKAAKRILERLGYRVLTAALPSLADELLATHHEEIVLLLTDVVMPQQSGRQLYESARSRYPQLRVLYMSGYPAHAMGPGQKLELGAAFLQKPFTRESLAEKVRAVLEEPSP